MAQNGRCDESTTQVDDPIGDRLYRAVTSNVLLWEPWISGSLASVPTVPDDATDASQARLDKDRPSPQRQTHLEAACSRRTIAPEVVRREPSQRTVMMTYPFPSTVFLQCDNPGCVFFIDGWHQRIPFEKRERRILDFQCPACDSYVKIRARTVRSTSSVRRFSV